jgi:hypothetical protein
LRFRNPLLERGIPMKVESPGQTRLSIIQLMKVVVFCAVAFACVAPMLHLWQIGVVNGGTAQGLLVVAIFEAIAVPLVWAGLSLCLIRRGDWRDGLISLFLLCSVVAALGVSCWLLVAYTIPAYGNPLDPPERRVDISSVALHVLIILSLSAATLFLSLRFRRMRSRAVVHACHA